MMTCLSPFYHIQYIDELLYKKNILLLYLYNNLFFIVFFNYVINIVRVYVYSWIKPSSYDIN